MVYSCIIAAAYIIDDDVKWLASPQTTHQRLALKRLPHRKCMAKLWNVITPLPYYRMKRFSDMFSGSRQATNWTKFEVCTLFSRWVIKRFWGISSTWMYYSIIFFGYRLGLQCQLGQQAPYHTHCHESIHILHNLKICTKSGTTAMNLQKVIKVWLYNFVTFNVGSPHCIISKNFGKDLNLAIWRLF